jgi:hypothetical protein
MFKLTLKKNGREIPVERFADELRADVYRAARQGIEERVRAAVASLRGPEHGHAVRDVTVDYDGGEEGAIKATPCCNAMDAEVGRAVRAAFGEE